MAEHRMLKAEELEVGMKVAYPYSVSVGWHRGFRYPRWMECYVKRITPKRTKAVLLLKDGGTIDVNLKEYSVYVPDVTMNRENTCLKKFLDCLKALNKYNGGKWKALWALSDEELDEAHKYLMELEAIMNRERSETND